jgi:radical S-adenosyl methionine domain-containing protein 2
MKKINFSGGEPLIIENGDFLGELCIYCKKDLKIESVSVICNGSLVTEQWFEKYAKYIDVFGLSIDSFEKDTLIDIGRYGPEGAVVNIDKIYAIRAWCRKYGLKFKINTVVTKQVLIEDMTLHIRELQPDRWKVFQCLLIDGENVGNEALRDAAQCAVTLGEFKDWIHLHAELSPVVESNDMMMNSYLILDEKMRFLNCTQGRKDPSVSILDGGVLKALVEAGHDQQTFYQRGGSYDWSRTPSSSIPDC